MYDVAWSIEFEQEQDLEWGHYLFCQLFTRTIHQKFQLSPLLPGCYYGYVVVCVFWTNFTCNNQLFLSEVERGIEYQFKAYWHNTPTEVLTTLDSTYHAYSPNQTHK